MGMKGFYFSFDAIIGLLVLTATASLILSSLNQPGVTPENIEFSQYSSQADDITNYMQRREASALEPEVNISPSNRDRKISELLTVKALENESKAKKISRHIMKRENHDSKIYLKEDQTNQKIYSDTEANFTNSASSKLLTVNQSEVYEILVVVGE
jgi:hypothetical protein